MSEISLGYNVSQVGSFHFGGQSEEEEEEEEGLSWLQICLLVYLVVVFVLGTSINTSLLLTFFRKSSLRTTSNR